MKSFRISLLVGFVAEMVCAFIAALGAANSEMLARIATIIHTPSMLVARWAFPDGGRSTIFRDAACIFAVQWTIYTLIIFATVSLVQRNKSGV
jgi:hypothetical protein